MTDHNFTDDEIIELLNAYVERMCGKCNVKDLGTCCGSCFITAISQAADIVKSRKAEIERLQAVHADMTESLRLAAEANKDMSVELDAMRGAANSYKMHYEETERKYKIAVAEREANVEGFIETLKTIKTEAIKEFAERLIKKCDAPHWCVWMSEIEDLKEEMTENKR